MFCVFLLRQKRKKTEHTYIGHRVVWKMLKFTLESFHHFPQKFREIKALDNNIFQAIVIFLFFHAVLV